MRLRKIETNQDIEIVKSFFYNIFLDESGYDLHHLQDSIRKHHNYTCIEYYLAYEENTAVGITGLYANQASECWLGWFGIRPEYRHRGYANKMLDLTLEKMQKYGYKVCRIYTNSVHNEDAVKLYLKKGFQINSKSRGNIITMAKSLDDSIVISKWKGKPLGFVPEWPMHS